MHLEVVVAHLAALVHRVVEARPAALVHWVAVEARLAALVHQVAVVAVVYLLDSAHRVALALAPLLLTLLAAPRSPARLVGVVFGTD